MKKTELLSIIQEVIKEQSATGTGASFTPGTGAQIATPAAFTRNREGSKRGAQTLKKIGYKKAKVNKHTKLVDAL